MIPHDQSVPLPDTVVAAITLVLKTQVYFSLIDLRGEQFEHNENFTFPYRQLHHQVTQEEGETLPS